jgi:putative endonuclease
MICWKLEQKWRYAINFNKKYGRVLKKSSDMKHFKEYNFWVYIMFNERAKATYIGMTNNLARRVIEHKMGLVLGNSKEKGTNKLAHYEWFKYVDKAIARERALKEWNRVWKFCLIEQHNPDWLDLAASADEYVANRKKLSEVPAEAFGFIDQPRRRARRQKIVPQFFVRR